jgi:hypothetical protein
MKNKRQVPNAKKASKVPKTAKSRKPVAQAIPASAMCFIRPFNSTAVHFPDADVQPSGLVSSHYTLTTVFTANSGTSTTHSGGFIIFPYPGLAVNALVETAAGNGLLTDVNSTGTIAVLSADVPNKGSMYKLDGRVRCVGLGARLIYEGTELNRSGKIFGGCLPITSVASSVSGTGTILSPSTVILGNTFNSTTNIRSALADLYEIRNPSEKVVEFIWKPSTPPHYQTITTLPINSTTAGASVLTSAFSAPAGEQGAESGQSALVIVIEGDTTPTAVVNSNTYSLEIIWHWEVIPDSIAAVPYDLSPSTANSRDLDTVVNLVSRSPAGRADTLSSVSYSNGLGFQGTPSIRR